MFEANCRQIESNRNEANRIHLVIMNISTKKISVQVYTKMCYTLTHLQSSNRIEVTLTFL